MKFILSVTNSYKEVYYFVRHGDAWPHQPHLRLIAETARDRARAHQFDTIPEALAAIKLAGDPPGWQVVTVE